MLVHDGQRALLGRQASWPPNRYSTIAGFVEPGETLEDAVRREVSEETGVRVSTVDYHSSQPWPFPSSLMLGFQAQGDYAVPVLHDGELEDARWFTSEELRAGAVLLPPRETISRRLIDSWLDAVALMCLLLLAWKVHRAVRTAAGGQPRRAACPAHCGTGLLGRTGRGVLGGRDLVAAGTWLAARADGKFAAVTNFVTRRPAPSCAPAANWSCVISTAAWSPEAFSAGYGRGSISLWWLQPDRGRYGTAVLCLQSQ